MQRIKRVLAIHDISCVGRCSLTVALPIISAAGIETSVLPTAVLSTHTGGFKNFTLHDLTSEMPKIDGSLARAGRGVRCDIYGISVFERADGNNCGADGRSSGGNAYN